MKSVHFENEPKNKDFKEIKENDRTDNYVNVADTNKMTNDEMLNVNIYRFKFSDEIMNELLSFSKMNQYVDRILYKEKWSEWVSENKELIDIEISRLQKLGYDGDILDKMFKASRYYFRKKSLGKVDTKSRQKYNSLDQDILYKMDSHILHNIKKEYYTPASGYSSFCLENVNALKIEIKRLLNNETILQDNISYKIKKTYKNRYFIISRNIINDNDIVNEPRNDFEKKNKIKHSEFESSDENKDIKIRMNLNNNDN